MTISSVNKENFRGQIEYGVTLVEFYAAGDNQCKIQNPIVEQLAEELKSHAAVVKVDIDMETELALEYGVRSIPTFLLFKDGYMVEQFVGLQEKEHLKNKIESYTSMGDTC